MYSIVNRAYDDIFIKDALKTATAATTAGYNTLVDDLTTIRQSTGRISELKQQLQRIHEEIDGFFEQEGQPRFHIDAGSFGGDIMVNKLAFIPTNNTEITNAVKWGVKQEDKNAKIVIPLLYALATSPKYYAADILQFMEVELIPAESGTSEPAQSKSITINGEGKWTQDGDSSRQNVKATIKQTPRFEFVYLVDLIDDQIRRIRGYQTKLETQLDCASETLKGNELPDEIGVKRQKVDDQQRRQRNAIWADAHREMIISGDRLYAFLRVMAGTLNEDVTAALNVEDHALDASQQEYRKQRSDLLRQQRMFTQRVINDLLSSVFRSSNFRVDLFKDKEYNKQIVIVNEESIEKVRELSESSSVQFLSQNVDLLRAFENLKGDPLPLNQFVDKVQGILHDQNLQAQAQLARTQYQSNQNSLDYLAEPRNSYVVRLKNEAFAAIRNAFHTFKNEWRVRNIQEDPPTAWDLVEGGPDDLTDAFAQFSAYLWSNARLFSSSTAAFIGVTPAKINLIVLRTALIKLVNRAYNFKRTAGSKGRLDPGDPNFDVVESPGAVKGIAV